MLFLPLRANAGRERLLCDGIVFGCTDSRLQGLQHRTISALLDALWQFARLGGGTIQDGFNVGCIGFVAEGSGKLLGDGGSRSGIVQGMRFLPLRANTGREGFSGDSIILPCADTGMQGVQDVAVGVLPHVWRQETRLCGSTVEHRFDGGCVSSIAKRSGQLLCDGGAGNRVLQGVFFPPTCANSSSQGFLGGRIVAGFANIGVQFLQHRAIGGLMHVLRQLCRLCSGTVKHGGNGGFFHRAIESGADLLREGSAGGTVLQAVRVLPL